MKTFKNNLMVVLTLVSIIVSLVVVSATAISNNNRYTEWENTRGIITVTVGHGDTLDDFGYQYKPVWMDVRQYRDEVMELNDMPSAMLYASQPLKLYVCCEQYTLDGVCLDDGCTIITSNGHSWTYYTDVVGCVEVTLNDNGTPDYIDDDIIVNIMEVR